MNHACAADRLDITPMQPVRHRCLSPTVFLWPCNWFKTVSTGSRADMVMRERLHVAACLDEDPLFDMLFADDFE